MSADKFLTGIQNQDLRIPLSMLEAVRRFTMTQTDGEGTKDHDDCPFNRYVDIWWGRIMFRGSAKQANYCR